MKVAFRFAILGALTFLVAAAASAQLAKGFRGKVLDMGGKPVAGATVSLTDESNPGNHYDVKTDDHGEYIQIGIPYSEKGYEVSVHLPGMPVLGMIAKPKLMTLTDLTFDPRKCVGFQGTVNDKGGRPLSNVTVTITNLDDEAHPFTTKTDSKGFYKKTDLPYSDKGYKLTAQIPGEAPLSKSLAVPPQMVGQADSQAEGPIHQVAVMVADLKFGAPEEGSTGTSQTASQTAEAKQMYDLGDYEGALAKADEAIASKDTDKESLKAAKLIRATCLKKLDRTDEAIAAFEDYNKDNPGNVNVLGELYNLCEKKGDKAKAEMYKKEFQAKGGQVQGATYNEGVNALNDGNAEKAVTLFQAAIKENPADPDSHRELARSYAQLGKFPETIEELKIYLKMKPNADDAETWKQAIAGLEQAVQQQHKKK